MIAERVRMRKGERRKKGREVGEEERGSAREEVVREIRAA